MGRAGPSAFEISNVLNAPTLTDTMRTRVLERWGSDVLDRGYHEQDCSPPAGLPSGIRSLTLPLLSKGRESSLSGVEEGLRLPSEPLGET